MERPSKEQISELPLYIGLGLADIYIVENELDAAQAIEALKNETSLGFDTESKPIFQKGEVSPGPSLIQLATELKAFLFSGSISCRRCSGQGNFNQPKHQEDRLWHQRR